MVLIPNETWFEEKFVRPTSTGMTESKMQRAIEKKPAGKAGLFASAKDGK